MTSIYTRLKNKIALQELYVRYRYISTFFLLLFFFSFIVTLFMYTLGILGEYLVYILVCICIYTFNLSVCIWYIIVVTLDCVFLSHCSIF